MNYYLNLFHLHLKSLSCTFNQSFEHFKCKADSDEIHIYYTNPNNPDTDGDGVTDPQDIDPLIDLQLSLKVKRVYSSEYTYTWREAETWDASGNYASRGSPWTIEYNDDASNREYTRQADTIGINDYAEWLYTVEKAGMYHVWIRYHRSPIGCSNVVPIWKSLGYPDDEFFVKRWDDGAPSYDATWYTRPEYESIWQWSWFGVVYMHTGDGTLRIENRPEEGLDPNKREGDANNYMEIDNILITDDPNCAPTGKGFEGGADTVIGYPSPEVWDPDSPPDFYVKTSIGGVWYTSQVWYDDYNVLNDWIVTQNVPDNVATVPVCIELYDEDGSIDQKCDIGLNPGPATQDSCNLIYNLNTGTWSGDDSVDDIDFIGRTCGEVDGDERNFDADVIFELYQNDYDQDGITYWQEVFGPYDGSIQPTVTNNRYAVIVGGGASGKLRQQNDIGSYSSPYKGTYFRYNEGYGWTDYTMRVDMMTTDDIDTDNEEIGVMFRYQNANNYYLFRWENNGATDKMRLWKFVNGVKTSLGEVSSDLTRDQWYTIEVRVSGSNINIYKNINAPLSLGASAFQLVFSKVDSSLSSGTIALFTWRDRGAYFDDIYVKNPSGDYLLSEGFDYGRLDQWTKVDEALGSSNWGITSIGVDQEDFYVGPDYIVRELHLIAHIPETMIMYLSADKYRDVDGDGVNDVDGVSIKPNVQYLLEEWFSTYSDSNDLNLFYIFDHGFSDGAGSYVMIDSDRNGALGGSGDKVMILRLILGYRIIILV
jgi:hypothetical protein